jgi:hypothetical protein
MTGGQDARAPNHFLQTLGILDVLFGIETHGVFNMHPCISGDAQDRFLPAKDDPRNTVDRRVNDLPLTQGANDHRP